MAVDESPHPPNTLEEFEQRLAEAEKRLKLEGSSPRVMAEFESLYANVGLRVVLGPTRALSDPGKPMSHWPTDIDYNFYADLLETSNKELSQLFKDDDWGNARLRFSHSVLEEHECPAIRVTWDKPMELLSNHQRNPHDVSVKIEAMIAGMSLILAVAWHAWRIEMI